MKAEYLTHKDGTRIVPITQPDAVIDSEGKSLTTTLAAMEEEIESKGSGKVQDVRVNGTSVLDEDGVANVNMSGKADKTDLAPEYSSTSAYAVGEIAYYNGKLYECKVEIAIGGEAWNTDHWSSLSGISSVTSQIARKLKECDEKLVEVETATSEAENVNAEIDVDNKEITITNRKGKSTTTSFATEGTTDYEQLTNKPKIGGVELSDNKTIGELGGMRMFNINDYKDGSLIDGSYPFDVYYAGDDFCYYSSHHRYVPNGGFRFDCFVHETDRNLCLSYSVLLISNNGYKFVGFVDVETGKLYDTSYENEIKYINGFTYDALYDIISYAFNEHTATTSTDGLMSATDKTKLDGIDMSTKADKTDLADAYDTSTSYAVGALCIYNNALYKCTTATSGEWDSSCWNSTTIGKENLDLSRNLNGKFDTPQSKTIEGFGITDAYTKTEIDTMIGNVETLLASI